MALSLNYSNLAETVQQTNKLGEELGQYCDELSRKVQKNIYSVEGGMSTHLNNADYFIKNKIKNLREKQENAYNISKCVNNLLSTAQRVDDDVARLIENRQKEFFKENPDLKTPLYQSVIQELIGTTPLGSFLLALNLFKHFSPFEELQKNIKNSFKSAFNSAQNYVDNISDKVSSTVKNITDKEDKKSTGNVLAVAGILAGANSVKSWVSDLITNIKDFWQKHWGTAITTTTATTEANDTLPSSKPSQETYEEKVARLKAWTESDRANNIQAQLRHMEGDYTYDEKSGSYFMKEKPVGICNVCATVNLLNRRMELDGSSGKRFTAISAIESCGNKVDQSRGFVTMKYYSDGDLKTGYGYAYSGKGTGNIYSSKIYNENYTVAYDMTNASIPSTINERKQKIIDLLANHPEGIVVRSTYSGGGGHAIVITDYYIDANNQYHFNIVDSVNQYSGSIEKSYYGKNGGWNNWDTFVSGITHISYVK